MTDNNSPLIKVLKSEGFKVVKGDNDFLTDCPFCNKKKQLKIYSKKYTHETSETYYCLNCNIRGDVFDVICFIKKFDLQESVYYLDRKYKIFGDFPEEVVRLEWLEDVYL